MITKRWQIFWPPVFDPKDIQLTVWLGCFAALFYAMDFADATLVALAEERKTSEIFTLDRRGFSTYRIHSRKAFTIYPE